MSTTLKLLDEALALLAIHCPRRGRDGCRFTVESTPRVFKNHADRFRKAVDACEHQAGEA